MMKAVKEVTMRTLAKFFGAAGGLLAIVGLLLVGCAPDTSAPTLQSRPTEETPPTEAVAAAPTVSNVMSRVPPFTDTACLNCHTDQPALVELALPEDADHEALSSGPG